MYVNISCSIPVFKKKVCILHIAGYNNKSDDKISDVKNVSLLPSRFSSGLILLEYTKPSNVNSFGTCVEPSISAGAHVE